MIRPERGRLRVVEHPCEMPFFSRKGPFLLSELAQSVGASCSSGSEDISISDVAVLAEAGPSDIALYGNVAYRTDLADARAGAIITRAKLSDDLPEGIPSLICDKPGEAFEALVRLFYPGAGLPGAVHESDGVSPQAHVHEDARLEPDVTVEPGASIGARAEIGSGSRVLTGAVVGADVRIGRDCTIAPGASVAHAFIGNRVVLHPGVRVGQDGFGYSPGPKGLEKAFQIGRVIIQDDVEIGANSCIDRGGVRDTIVGEGTKIDNLVQIAHNCTIGRHCIIVSMTALAGSVTLGDGVMIGGNTVINNHVRIADGVRIAGASAVNTDIERAGDWAGVPAQPRRTWYRELMILKRLAQEHRTRGKAKGEQDGDD